MLKTELVTPKGGKKVGVGRGGEVVRMDEFHVEFLVLKPHPPHEGKAEAGHDDEDGTPYFKAVLDLSAYTCGMKGHPVVAKPGTCRKCPMKLKAVEREFRAVVIFKIKGDTKNAKGFQYPPVVPDNYKDAVAKIDEHVRTIEALVKADDNDKAHAVALKITRICEKLPDLAPGKDRATFGAMFLMITVGWGIFAHDGSASGRARCQTPSKIVPAIVDSRHCGTSSGEPRQSKRTAAPRQSPCDEWSRDADSARRVRRTARFQRWAVIP